MPKFLHAADIHLDSPLQKLAAYEHAPVDRIRDASRAALSAMVDLAIDQNVDAVLIAGDLYDGNWTDHNTGLQFVRQAARLIDHDIPVLVIRGNHDAASVITSSLTLPDNPDGSPIMFASDRTECRTVDSAGLVVHGRSFADRVVTENLAADYGKPVPGMANVGMLHTSLTGAEGHDTYSPCTTDDLNGKGYDYWALGHVHIRQNHQTGQGAPIVFPGNLQGRHIRETGPKGCMIVDVDSSHRCNPVFHPLGDVRWMRCPVPGEKLKHPDEVAGWVRRWLEDEMTDAGELLIVRVEVAGQSPIDSQLRRSATGTLADLQSLTVAMADGRVWLEDYKVRTRPPAAGGVVIGEGPMRSLQVAVQSMREDAGAGKAIGDLIDSLRQKLPDELTGEDSPIRPDDPRWAEELIDEAAAELVAAISGDNQ